MPLVFLTAVALIVYVVPIAVHDYDSWNEIYYLEVLEGFGPVNVYTAEIIAFLIVASLVMPIWSMSYKMNARSCDIYYSLPISRRKLLAVNFFTGFATVIAAYTVAYLIGFFVILGKVEHIHLAHYGWLYFALIVPSFISYATSAFFFTRANRAVDGAVFVVASQFILFVAAEFLHVAVINFGGKYGVINGSSYFGFSPYIWIYDSFVEYLVYGYEKITAQRLNNNIAGSVIVAAAAIAATAWLFVSEKRAKAENCERISDSIFGYKTLIPYFSVLLYLNYAFENAGSIVATFAVIFIASYAMSALYRRTLKIGKKSLAIIVGCLVAAVIAALIINSTAG